MSIFAILLKSSTLLSIPRMARILFWRKSNRRVHHSRSTKVWHRWLTVIFDFVDSFHVGAVYIHQGRTYLVEECNVDQRYAKVHAARVDYTTQQRDFTNANAITTVMSKPIQVNEKKTRNRVSYGRIQSMSYLLKG